MARKNNFNHGRGRLPADQQAKLDWIRNGDKPKQGQDPDQGFPITVHPQNECSSCDAKYFLPEHLELHTNVKHPPRFL